MKLLLFFFFVGLVWAIITYNRMVASRASISQSLADLSSVLRQRNTELTTIAEICAQSIIVELNEIEATLKAKTSLSENPDVKQTLDKLVLVMEDYPELKSAANIKNLLNRITSLEELIADMRENYNYKVNDYNIAVSSFPDNIIAVMFRFKKFNTINYK